MPRGGSRTAHTDTDKARILVTLAANGGNVLRTARECSVSPASIRRWREDDRRGTGPSKSAVVAQIGVFVDDAERVRNKALAVLEQRINDGEIKPSELIATLGVLDDKITRAKGLPTQRVEHGNGLPQAADLAALGAVVAGAIAAASTRHDEIVEAEIVEDATLALPSAAE
jgi:transposase-like protein